MGYINKTKDGGRRVPAGLIVLILGLVLFGSALGPAPALATSISCGQCHSNPPADTDNICGKQVAKNHPAHATSDTSTCLRCHPAPGTIGSPSATHYNGHINITSTAASPGLHYNSTSSQCTNACHKNQSSATWGGSVDCNRCHYRSGTPGGYTMSGLHVRSDRAYGHFSSAIKVIDNTKTITCVNCHPAVLENSTSSHLNHIKTTDFKSRADMSQAFSNVTVTGVGYRKGLTQGTGSCANSCHYNVNDITNGFGNYTIHFKAGQSKRFGGYSTERWSGSDLKCNECHSTPSQSATLGTGPTDPLSINANLRHKNHMFRYKLNAYNFASEDRNIYCDDCHKTPDINAARGFRHHSTIGQGGSGVISLPVKSQNARVFVRYRNNGIGRDGINFATFTTSSGTPTCNNIYCHTIMTSGQWTEDACNKCHGKLDGADTGSGAPGFWNLTTAGNNSTYEEYAGGGGAHYSHVMKRGYPCRTCHFRGGGDGNPLNHHTNTQTNPLVYDANGLPLVDRANVNVDVQPDYWFNNQSSVYDWNTRSCNNVKCHFGASQDWDCAPLH